MWGRRSGFVVCLAPALDHLGPAVQTWWDDLGSPTLTEETKRLLAAGCAAEVGDRSAEDILRERDRLLSRIIALIGESPVL